MGFDIQRGILHVLMNILSISLLLRVNYMSGCFRMQLEFMFKKHYAPNRCEPSIEVFYENGGPMGGGGRVLGGGCQGGCERERRI